MKEAPLVSRMSASSLSGICCPPGDLLRRLTVLRLEPDDEVEEPLPLHDLRRRRPADRGLEEGVDVGDVEAIARDLLAVGRDGEARLPELAHDGDLVDAAHFPEHCPDRVRLVLEDGEVGSEDFHGE